MEMGQLELASILKDWYVNMRRQDGTVFKEANHLEHNR